MTHDELIENGFNQDQFDWTYRIGKYRFSHLQLDEKIVITGVGEYENYHGVALKHVMTIEGLLFIVNNILE
jgi:hypothetical protein